MGVGLREWGKCGVIQGLGHRVNVGNTGRAGWGGDENHEFALGPQGVLPRRQLHGTAMKREVWILSYSLVECESPLAEDLLCARFYTDSC